MRISDSSDLGSMPFARAFRIPHSQFRILEPLSSVTGQVTFLIRCATCYTETPKFEHLKAAYFQSDEVVMIRVGIEDLKSGMILERPVKNHQGVLLLEAGAKITKKNIRIFKSWGVDEINVKGEATRAGDTPGQPESQIAEPDEMQLKEKFADVLNNPVMVEIYKAASRQLNKDLPNNESKDEHS